MSNSRRSRFCSAIVPHLPAFPILSALVVALAGLMVASVAAVESAQAGAIEPDFAARLAAMPPGETVSGLVMLAEQPDVRQMEREMGERGIASRWRRHQYVVEHVRDLASRSQAALLGMLSDAQAQGTVRSVASFWVTNMIAVETTPELFERIAARADVGTIYENAPIELRLGWPDDGPNGAGSVDGTRALGNGMDGDNPILPDNLVCVNVQPAWDQDLKGQGRLVADFDTGADGNHPAFASRWRGAQPGVDWSWAWKDPYTNTQFPYDHAIHGTHTLGIMVGEKPDGTPIGVAPGAEWIAAGILIDYNVQLIIECYQWAIDPDGDPSTIVDVPDVINNSWGTSGNCDPTYWGAIDVVEAAGIVNTIAVDNTGPSPGSVNSPESRCDTPNVNWGVGNVNPHIEGYPIASSSGRGPSPCDGVSIKPEVTAPGTQIYSTLPGNSYGNLSGTSMACPHTSGAVAILRQVNPDLTVDEVKTALMATAVDKGTAGEDNDYGWGIIDIGAAVAYVQQTLPALPPRNLVALADSNDVHLSWERPESLDPGNPLQQYRIYRAAAGDSFPPDPIAEVGVLAAFPSYDDLDLSAGQYRYVVTAVYARGESGPSNEADVAIDASSSVADLGAAAASLVLGVSPNPFQPRTVIRYRALGTSPIALAVYDPSGKRVRVLAEGRSGDANAGGVERGASGSLVWDGTDDAGRRLASGVYFVKLEQAGVARTERVSLLK